MVFRKYSKDLERFRKKIRRSETPYFNVFPTLLPENIFSNTKLTTLFEKNKYRKISQDFERFRKKIPDEESHDFKRFRKNEVNVL